MARNGAGQYEIPVGSWYPPISGTPATAADWQVMIEDLAAAMTQSIARDGQTTILQNLPMGGNKLTGLSAGTAAGDSLRYEQLFSQGRPQNLASAATTDIGAQLTTNLNITGTTTITSFGVNYNGPRFLVFSGAVTLTHSATLVLPGAANILTAAGDTAIAIPIGSPANGWKVVDYVRAAAAPYPGGQIAGNRNKIINGNFSINQRAYMSGTVTTVGAYTFDRWKVTSTPGLTFTIVDNKTTVTVPPGQTIQQIIEGINVHSGIHVLSWEGTAQGRINGGTYGTSGNVRATIVGGTDTTIEFNAGTVTNVQFEPGSFSTPFEHRLYPQELIFCQRYFEINDVGPGVYLRLSAPGSTPMTLQSFNVYFSVDKRVTPTVNLYFTVGSSLAANSITRKSFTVSGNPDSGGITSCKWTSNAEM